MNKCKYKRNMEQLHVNENTRKHSKCGVWYHYFNFNLFIFNLQYKLTFCAKNNQNIDINIINIDISPFS